MTHKEFILNLILLGYTLDKLMTNTLVYQKRSMYVQFSRADYHSIKYARVLCCWKEGDNTFTLDNTTYKKMIQHLRNDDDTTEIIG